MKKRIITAILFVSLLFILGGCTSKGNSENSEKNTNGQVNTTTNSDNNKTTTDNSSSTTEKSTVVNTTGDIDKTVNTSNDKNDSNTQPEILTSSKMNDLLNNLQGDWYDLNDETFIKENGVKHLITIEKDGSDYTLINSFPDTALSFKISDIKYLGNKGSYLITTHNGDDKKNIDFTFNIGDDKKSINITSEYDKNIKYVKATSEIKQYVQMLRLKGTYRDEQDKEYNFKDGGIAVWPNNTFKFSVLFIEKIFPDSSPWKAVYNYIIVNDANGKETTRYFYEIIDNKLNIYKTTLDKENNYNKGDLIVSLTKSNGTTDLVQKSIDIVAKKYNATIEYKVESGQIIYKSEIGEISFNCTGPDKENKYKVSIFKENTNDTNDSDAFKEFYVDVISGSVEEIK